MKFDRIISNPPFLQEKHLKIDTLTVDKVLKDGGTCSSISPVSFIEVCCFRDKSTGFLPIFLGTVEKYLTKCTAVECGEANRLFNITPDGILGIKVYKKDGQEHSGVLDKVMEDRQGPLVEIYNILKGRIAAGKFVSILDAYYTEDGQVVKSIERIKEIGKPYIRISGGIGGGGRFKDDGTPKSDYSSIYSTMPARNIIDVQNTKGGFIVFDSQEEYERTVARMSGKGHWLVRACSMSVKYGRNLKPQFVPFFDPKDPSTDEELARAWGMSEELIASTRKYMEPYI